MSASIDEPDARGGGSAGQRSGCPDWCVARHGVQQGEEDWVHVGAPLALADDVVAHACMSLEPGTGKVDGPYVIIGGRQYSPAEAEELAAMLIALTRAVRITGPLATA
jgi:hypothetical protein